MQLEEHTQVVPVVDKLVIPACLVLLAERLPVAALLAALAAVQVGALVEAWVGMLAGMPIEPQSGALVEPAQTEVALGHVQLEMLLRWWDLRLQ